MSSFQYDIYKLILQPCKCWKMPKVFDDLHTMQYGIRCECGAELTVSFDYVNAFGMRALVKQWNEGKAWQ